jgi:solute carrier family 50 protein (sugar transporter)
MMIGASSDGHIGDSDPYYMDLFLHHIVPGIGCLVALAMFASPLKAVLLVRKRTHLGELNPLPFVAIIANCAGRLLPMHHSGRTLRRSTSETKADIVQPKSKNCKGDMFYVVLPCFFIGWLIYGCLHRDPYVIAANVPGLLLGFFMTLSCYGFAAPPVSFARRCVALAAEYGREASEAQPTHTCTYGSL